MEKKKHYRPYRTKEYYSNKPEIKKLIKSAKYKKIIQSLSSLSARVPDIDIEEFLWGVTSDALRGPDMTEKMTGSERAARASKIKKSAQELKRAIMPIISDRTRFPPDYQITFGSFAAEAALDYALRFRALKGEALDKFVHETRYPISYLLREGIPDLLDVITEATEAWAARKYLLSKPNDKNASRLYFIRSVTDFFMMMFNAPLREVTLAITAVYFNCDDIDEAALSRLARVNPNAKDITMHRRYKPV